MSVGAGAYGRKQPVNPSCAEASQGLPCFLQPLLITCRGCEAPELLHTAWATTQCRLHHNTKGMLLQMQSQKVENVHAKALAFCYLHLNISFLLAHTENDIISKHYHNCFSPQPSMHQGCAAHLANPEAVFSTL